MNKHDTNNGRKPIPYYDSVHNTNMAHHNTRLEDTMTYTREQQRTSISYKERVYYNTHSYGRSFKIPIRMIYTILAIVVPIVIPLPLALLMPKTWVYRG